MQIAIEGPGAGDVTALLAYHVAEARRLSPPGFSFALPGDALQGDDITFWTARKAGMLLGFGALKDLGDGTGEVKSMRTAPEHLRKGVGASILDVIIDAARMRGHSTLYLETGVSEDYMAARALYERRGFAPCDPFANYEASGFNWFMKLSL